MATLLDLTSLGYTSAEVNEFAFTALSRRLKVIGVGLPGCQLPIRRPLPPAAA